ncbi:winged helix-turn-helix domain-containing protein [Cohnella boryungensis]|uniref:Winged helix-turn-helix domain-containing protein n=1 Tax=Cohnella boryungensis TaxID=768479 RepID=A0ABV8SL93_9BACL
MIQFDSDTCQAVYAGGSIQLLPKEFALLRFLYEHAGRAFSREELLDAVWPLEAPVDRTVDDHIYRIRKKISVWPHLLHVGTVRGQGYKLIRHAPLQQESPLLQDSQFADDVHRMLGKYHQLGMGAAMQLLSTHRSLLSLPGDPYYDDYLHFIQGDFEWLLSTDSISDWQKVLYAAFFHATLQFKPEASLCYFERLLDKDLPLSREWRSDLRLNAVHLYLEAGSPKKAQEALDSLRKDIADLHSPSFTALFLLKEMYVRLQEDDLAAAAVKLEECGALLARHPIRRERGAFLAAKAIYLYRLGKIPLAGQTLDEALETIRETHFIPHLLIHLRMALRHLRSYSLDEARQVKYARQWDALSMHYRFGELLAAAEHLLRKHL